MFHRLGQFVTRFWLVVILGWVAILAGVYLVAPKWDDVTHDGDLAYMPDSMPSVQGERLLEQAFPENRAKSQVVLVVARRDEKFSLEDLKAGDALAARMHNYHGAAALQRAREHARRADKLRAAGNETEAIAAEAKAKSEFDAALAALNEAILLDERLAAPWHNRALVHEALGDAGAGADDRKIAASLDGGLAARADRVAPDGADAIPLLDVWTRHTEVVGRKLISKPAADGGQAQLIVLNLAHEFMATANMGVMDRIEKEVGLARAQLATVGPPRLEIGITGSAAVGGDMLRSAAESIKNTELYTLVAVVVILVLVYRSPLLVAVPLMTIVVSVAVATGIVAMLTQLGTLPGMDWWNFKVFKTTKIFIVVILYGSGTDFCLFLIARYREELAKGLGRAEALAEALSGVGDALAASALTTIFGLATMFFADFGKYSNSGPAIGLCLVVTLAACLTLAPALLRALGAIVFWPFGIRAAAGGGNASPVVSQTAPTNAMWDWLARQIMARPGLILVASVAILAPLAWRGGAVEVTYDLVSELDKNRESKRGTELLTKFYPVGESGPLTVLAVRENARFDDKENKQGMTRIEALTADLFKIDGVQSVRSVAEPLGDPPSRAGLFSSKRLLREHKLTRAHFLTQVPGLKGDVARFELVFDEEPFSLEAIDVVNRIDRRLYELASDPNSFWHRAEFYYAGTTAGIRDLRAVTRSDNTRIQILVVLAVLGILFLILRRPLVCVYMIVSVMFSYYVTMGATEWFFTWLYGETFHGLDWKVPLFLFVILVAVGEDYNIYLATRVFEEQQRFGPQRGLREAIVRTGGIITSCGIIMAGTFISMVASTLRGMVELGFALSLGVLLDTFIVRPILVPCFLALLLRWSGEQADEPPSDDRQPPREEPVNESSNGHPPAEERPRARNPAHQV
jgi:RND superfamily putative drug exporter